MSKLRDQLPRNESAASPGWLTHLARGLKKTSSRLANGISDIVNKRTLDEGVLMELEDFLITADLGGGTANKLTAALATTRFGKEVSGEEIREVMATEITKILEPVALPLSIDSAHKPFVVLMVGVNGAGKTTTIGKLAQQFRLERQSVSLAACDTFRAAAVEQLKIWGQRTDSQVIARDTGSDAAGLAFEALSIASKRGDNVLLIDTAGRLQNKGPLMEELQKIIRVIKKIDPTAPHATLLVLDATVGQNAHAQVEIFKDIAAVTGLVMTKLDGTAKGGVVVALANKFKMPVHYVGVGEEVNDLRPFTAHNFARSLMGLEN
ncbi:MAG TPA: signal recognition particle-docking protein FtsY [Rhodospirillaceae bacterium]|nr:signal recognition particle-docking protein FtsY [Candidatus Neomarinimicrobiota bacterium]HCX13788.1 signal recognition particle-docking protein FtsY [Rhodospirillaceae bacterium]|tara:strand:+ start:429 stop:1394 length:966 start_codon:yes stop_codon:yes gene_type:complete